MPQNTNLNVSPYFDDFDKNKNYNRVLFKPGTPVQARELTTLQTILQNQIESFGKHFFKEGSMVIPGQVSYDNQYTCVVIDDTHLGVPVSFYLDSMIGKRIQGESSGVTAKIESYLLNTSSERGVYTLYIKYQSSSSRDFSVNTFLDGENLLTLDDISYGFSTIRARTTFATCSLNNATFIGSAAKISEGVYFTRGFFVNIASQTVILDQYGNSPSYRVGLSLDEEIIVASNSNSDLFDNAQGFSNFASPGADRLKISATLIKKPINDFNDENFIELLRVENGILQNFVKNSEYNYLSDELARRTYDESGDYYIKPFSILPKESLNNRIGNEGVFLPNQVTKQGNIPNKNLGCFIVSPGKAFVRGYEIETIDTTIIDFEKPRETATQNSQSIPFNLGKQFRLNNVKGSIPVGFSTISQISLYDSRTSIAGVSSGTKIGVARVYDLKLRNAEYTNNSTQFDCSLYDIQTYTQLVLNTGITLTTPAFIEGKTSSASGYLVSDITNSNIISLYQVSGTFRINEQIIINGIENGRIISRVRDYSLSDVQQIVAANGTSGLGTFTADPVLSNNILLAEPGTLFTISAASAGVSTITTSNQNFYVGINTGDIISYTKQSGTLPTYNKVSSVDTLNKNITIIATPSTSNVNDGTLPGSSITSSDLRKVTLEVLNTTNSTLYSELNNTNISSLNLTNSNVTIKRSYNITVSSGAYSGTLETDINLTLVPFDEEDYNLTYITTGFIESLTEQKLQVSGRTVSLSGLSANGTAILTVTYTKSNTSNKTKVFNRCSSLVIDRSSLTSSGIGLTTLNDGLTYNTVYGTRVQDKEICLNVPDVSSIIGIYESSSTNDPALPKIYFDSLNSNINNLIKGELIVGATSGAVAMFVSVDGVNSVEVSYLNENRFSVNETVLFQETNISGIVNSITFGDKNIKNNFIFDDGQRLEYYDYSRIIRKSQVSPPTRKIRVIFNNYTINTSSGGDFVSIDSYDADRYDTNIGKINGIRNSDIIDLRPRVSNYSTLTTNRSPFEFDSRVFNSSTNSSTDIFAKDKTISLGYDYYLPRIDKLFLSKEGTFVLSKGVPSTSPKSPNNLDASLEIATIYYPPYLYDISSIYIKFASHKRYTMKDISKLEDRLSNVEYYTSLSLLEIDTKNLSIKDTRTGLDKFKCGFFVDNFKSYDGGDIRNINYKASVDTSLGILRPQHYTTSIDLMLGSEAIVGVGTTSRPDIDFRYANDLGSNNVRRVGDVICLNYANTVYVQNNFATSYENINPFNITNWIGSIELNPSSDTWVYPIRTQRNEDVEGNYTTAIQNTSLDTNCGLSPIEWDSWQTLWTGASSISGPNSYNIRSTSENLFPNTSTNNSSTPELLTSSSSSETTTQLSSRNGIQFGVSERNSNYNIGDLTVSTSVTTTMRSRNIEVIGRRMRALTRIYAFLDNVDLTNYMVPKLLEVRMVSGTFQAGERVIGRMTSGSYQTISFRLANQNHRFGPYNSPTQVYTLNPYDTSVALPTSYSSTTTILNVDTASLENQSESIYFGSVTIGMQLIGQTSNACAEVSNIRLITDSAGTFIGSLFIPDPSIPSTPSFSTGTKTLTLSSSPTNESTVTGFTGTISETNFEATGVSNSIENATLRIRSADIERTSSSTNRTSTETTSRIVTRTSANNRLSQTRVVSRGNDPFAQTFEVFEPNGIFLTKCDLFFRSKDSGNLPVTIQIRTTSSGVPTQEVLPFSEVTLEPALVSIGLTSTATTATTFTFPSPVYLETGNTYALVLLTNSDEYEVWTSVQGQVDISSTTNTTSENIVVSQQPILGSLYKPQNSSTWTPSPLEDLKFILYRADFVSSSGSVRFYNPELNIGNNQVATLRPNPIISNSRKILVGLAKSLTSADVNNLTPGKNITQRNYPFFSGVLESLVGAIGIGSTLSISNAGIGYTSTITYSNVSLTTLSGRGSGAKVNLSVNSSGVAVAATVSIGGTGYAIGDSLTVDSALTGGFGKNLILTIPNNAGIISAFNSLIIRNVQDEIDSSGTGNEIQYSTPTGIGTISSGFVNYKEIIEDGLHLKILHNNHGMYSQSNSVTLYNIESDYEPVSLLTELTPSSTTDVIVSSVGIFTSFENVEVSLSNPGYIKIGREIIKYTGFNLSTNTMTGITRGFGVSDDELLSIGLHPINSPVFKYEFNGISLRRINKTHDLQDIDIQKYPLSLDSYHIKIDTSTNGVDRNSGSPRLFFNQSRTGGTYNSGSIPGQSSLNGPKASQNVQFDLIRPNVQTLIPESTNIDTRIRTFSGSSIDGNETPFIDQGYSDISLNSNNIFNSPRLIGSRVNEISYLQNYPGFKSFTMEMVLSTTDTKVSPMIDLDRVNIITSMNRIDTPVSDFLSDPRVNSLYDDPHAAIYLSKILRLEKGADTLKVTFESFIDSSNDIRVMYRLLRSDTPDSQQLFEFFPGYDNLTPDGNVIDPKNNNGKPDRRPIISSSSSDFKTLEFTAKDLPTFTGFQIKIVMAGTNQSMVPKIKDFRALALI